MNENRETSSSTAKQSSPAGEGKSRKSGAYGGEESDRAVVPVKPANKAEAKHAKAGEAVEGRARTEDTIWMEASARMFRFAEFLLNAGALGIQFANTRWMETRAFAE